MNRFVLIALLTGIAIGAVTALSSPFFALMLSFGLVFVFVWFLDTKKGILVVLLVRSALDLFINYSIGFIKVSSAISVFIVIFTLFWLLSKRLFVKNPLTAYFVIFLTVSIFPTFLTGYYMAGLETWFKFLSLAAVYMLVYYYSQKDPLFAGKVVDAIVLSSVVPLIFGMYQFFTNTGNHETPGYNRIMSVFVHPSPYAFYLVIVLAAGIIGFFGKKFSHRVAYILVMFFVIIELFMTYTRGAWLGVAFIVAMMFLLSKSNVKYVLMIVMLCVLLAVYPLIEARFANLFSSKMEESSLASRVYIWTRMFHLIRDQWVTGYGLGTFRVFSERVLNWRIEAHNDYLKMLFEAGLFGLLAYLLLIIRALVLAARKIPNHRMQFIKNVVFCLFLSFCLMSLGDNIIDSLVSQWYLWSLLAISHALNLRIDIISGEAGLEGGLHVERENLVEPAVR